jgi:hypothetical protein
MTASDEPLLERPPPDPPRLRIHHLIGWTVGSALIGAWLRGVESLSKQQRPASATFFDSSLALLSSGVTVVTTGGMIFLTACAISWSMRGIKGLWSPGVWLSVLGTIEFMQVVNSFAIYASGASRESLLLTGWLLPASSAVMFCAIAMGPRLPWNWRLAFAFLAVGRLIEAIFATQFYLFQGDVWPPRGVLLWLAALPTHGVGPLVVVASAILIDCFRRRKWAWPHWSGLLSGCLSALSTKQ